MSVPLKTELKNCFSRKITCYKLPQHPRSVFSWHLDVCKLYDSPNDASGNGLQDFLYKKTFYKKMSLKNSKTLRKY